MIDNIHVPYRTLILTCCGRLLEDIGRATEDVELLRRSFTGFGRAGIPGVTDLP